MQGVARLLPATCMLSTELEAAKGFKCSILWPLLRLGQVGSPGLALQMAMKHLMIMFCSMVIGCRPADGHLIRRSHRSHA